MGRAQAHRGPDDFGLEIRGHFGCAHNRLSILDLTEAGRQPIADRRYVLVYNGEIYNWGRLRHLLASEGVEFRSQSDSEVLFHHLVRFGVDETLRVVEGMFAFALYDSEEDRLYLCRDRLGIKPLFWIQREGSVYWASEVKAIREAVRIEPDPLRTLFGVASIGDHSNEYTLFQDVLHVEPGTYLTLRPGGDPKVTRYFELTGEIDEPYYRELDGMPAGQVAERFRSLLTASVSKMLMSDAPMGAFVSGGVDSSLITALAVQQDRSLSLFTANVLGEHSELEDARLLASHLQRALHDAPFSPEMFVEGLAEATYHYEAPIVTHTNSVPFAGVAQLAHEQGVKAVLTGEGSDELFLGYPRLLTRRFKRFAELPFEALKSLCGLVPGLKRYLFPDSARSIEGFLELLVQRFERQRLRETGREALSFLDVGAAEEHYLTLQMIREGLIALLHRNDRMGMMASIESRFPFLDEKIVRFAVNLPTKFKIGRSLRFHNFKHPFLIDKAVVREVASELLPPQLVFKKKLGFPMYGHQYLKVRPGCFAGGYLAETLGLTSEDEDYLIRTQSPYHVAKLVSVEVFGRLFCFSQSVETVSDHLSRYVEMRQNQ